MKRTLFFFQASAAPDTLSPFVDSGTPKVSYSVEYYIMFITKIERTDDKLCIILPEIYSVNVLSGNTKVLKLVKGSNIEHPFNNLIG